MIFFSIYGKNYMSTTYYGIRFPFTNDSRDEMFVDMNSQFIEEVKSNLMHLIFTPIGSRIRMPDFGTSLIDYLFKPNDESTSVDVKLHIQEQVKRYMPNVDINKLIIEQSNDSEHMMNVTIKYSINTGSNTIKDEIKTLV